MAVEHTEELDDLVLVAQVLDDVLTVEYTTELLLLGCARMHPHALLTCLTVSLPNGEVACGLAAFQLLQKSVG